MHEKAVSDLRGLGKDEWSNKRRTVMKKKSKKKYFKVFGSVVVIALSLASLSGCSSFKETAANVENVQEIEKTDGVSPAKTQETTVQNTVGKTNQDNSTEIPSTTGTKDEPKGISDETDKAVSPNDTDVNSLTYYIGLLGLSKDELPGKINETPVSADEGGQEFEKAGIRVWFDDTSVSQIFTQRKDIDINGVNIGDKIDKFKEKFGEPVSDKNGDMHFKYKDVFLSVNYDTKSRDTFALYILKKDF